MLSKDSPSQDEYQKAADWLLAHTKLRPQVAIICGSGLGLLADALANQEAFQYKDIPGFPQSTVQGHAGRLVFGSLRGKPCVCMQGRFHFYEGHSLSKTTFPVRVFKLMGVATLIVTNAAGSLADSLSPGDIMVIKDHVNLPGLCGLNPLCGPNVDRFGPRFPAMSGCYDAGLRGVAAEIGKQLGVAAVMREGVYAMVGGPNFESIAEAKLLHRLGVDAVGMSTAPEVVVAVHCGLRVFGLSLITNKVVKSYEDQDSVDHEAVLEVGRVRAQTLQSFVTELVSRLDVNNNNDDNNAGTDQEGAPVIVHSNSAGSDHQGELSQTHSTAGSPDLQCEALLSQCSLRSSSPGHHTEGSTESA